MRSAKNTLQEGTVYIRTFRRGSKRPAFALLADEKYILQQGIDLATYRNRPFDIRMVLQKPNKVWRLTLTSAKVAQKKDAVVTNVARGQRIILYRANFRNTISGEILWQLYGSWLISPTKLPEYWVPPFP